MDKSNLNNIAKFVEQYRFIQKTPQKEVFLIIQRSLQILHLQVHLGVLFRLI